MSFSKEESREIWEQNAAFWDAAMGDASNDFHREAVRPGVTELLRPGPGDYILEIIMLIWSQGIGKIKTCAFAV